MAKLIDTKNNPLQEKKPIDKPKKTGTPIVNQPYPYVTTPKQNLNIDLKSGYFSDNSIYSGKINGQSVVADKNTLNNKYGNNWNNDTFYKEEEVYHDDIYNEDVSPEEAQNREQKYQQMDEESDKITSNNSNLNWVRRGMYPKDYPMIDNGDNTYSTHKLSYRTNDEDNKAYVYPNIIQNEDGTLKEFENDDDAWNYAKKTHTALEINGIDLGSYYSHNGLIKHVGNNIIERSNASFNDKLANVESSGSYSAINNTTNAIGKYQYVWKWHKDDIKNVTGIEDSEEFRNNPKAQEQYHSWELQNGFAKKHTDELYPKLKEKFPDMTYDDFRLIGHYNPGSLDDLLSGKKSLDDRPTDDENNMTLRQYINKANSKK